MEFVGAGMEWYTINLTQLIGIVITGVFIYSALIIFIKIVGLRALSKMSAHDFAVTIAIGSILGATISQENPSLLQGALSIAVLLALQYCVSMMRKHTNQTIFENSPLLIMKNGIFLEENLYKARMTRADVAAKLREANVLNMKDAKAVVFESTGDVSVLHGDKDIDDFIMKDVLT